MTSWFTAVREIQSAILSGADLDGALLLICRQAGAMMTSHSASIAMPDDEGSLVVEVAHGDDAAGLQGARAPAAGSVTAEVMAMGAAAVLDDLCCQGSFAAPFESTDLGPALFVPLHPDAGESGVMCVARRRGSPLFDEDEVAVAEAFAAQASLAIRTAATHQQLQDLAAAAGRLLELPPYDGSVGPGTRMIGQAVADLNRIMANLDVGAATGYPDSTLGTVTGA